MKPIRATTNFGGATVEIYNGYRGTPAVSFKLDCGGSYGGWALEGIKNFKHHELCLDGGSNLICSNIQDVVSQLKQLEEDV